MGRSLLLAMMALAVPYSPLRADLKRAMAEPDLEKRSRLAVENAKAAFDTLREAYGKGDLATVAAAAREIEESVALAGLSLRETGKNPRKNPKYFKSAEISTRDLLRRIEASQQAMDFDDRAVLDPARTRVQQVHDELLLGLMEGKKK